MNFIARVSQPSYAGMHKRIKSIKGPARAHLCKCGREAAEWSYDHSDPDEVSSDRGPYSLDPERYEPLCIPCHRSKDNRGMCRKGHPFTEESTYTYRGYRLCKICRKATMDKYNSQRKQK